MEFLVDRMADLVNIMADNWMPKYEKVMKFQMNNNNGNLNVNDKCTNVVNNNNTNDKYIFFNYSDLIPSYRAKNHEKVDFSVQCELHTPHDKNIQCNLSSKNLNKISNKVINLTKYSIK